MPAVGKSTVGIVVAKRLGMGFVDTDLLIQDQEKKLLREIIAEAGLDGFLKIENQVNAGGEREKFGNFAGRERHLLCGRDGTL